MKRFLPILGLLLFCPTIFAQQVASDNFTRANSPNLGANWTANPNAIQILSNAAAGVNTCAAPTQCLEYWSANSFNNNQYSQITTGNNASGFNESAVIRATTGGNAYVALVTSTGTLSIYKDVSNTFTSLASNSTSFAFGDVMLFSAVGTSLTVCKNGVSVLTKTDSTFASGNAGISIGADSSTNIQNWQGGNMSVAGCTIPSGASGGGGFGGSGGMGGKGGFGFVQLPIRAIWKKEL